MQHPAWSEVPLVSQHSIVSAQKKRRQWADGEAPWIGAGRVLRPYSQAGSEFVSQSVKLAVLKCLVHAQDHSTARPPHAGSCLPPRPAGRPGSASGSVPWLPVPPGRGWSGDARFRSALCASAPHARGSRPPFSRLPASIHAVPSACSALLPCPPHGDLLPHSAACPRVSTHRTVPGGWDSLFLCPGGESWMCGPGPGCLRDAGRVSLWLLTGTGIPGTTPGFKAASFRSPFMHPERLDFASDVHSDHS